MAGRHGRATLFAMKSHKKAGQTPKPDIEPIPGSVPKRFPNQPEPLASGAPSSSPDEQDDPSTRSGSGQGPEVESGLPDHDPERPRETIDDKPM